MISPMLYPRIPRWERRPLHVKSSQASSGWVATSRIEGRKNDLNSAMPSVIDFGSAFLNGMPQSNVMSR